MGGPRRPRVKDMSVLIAGNWKMFKGPGETAAFCAELLEQLDDDGRRGVDVVVAPPFVSLQAAASELEGSRSACTPRTFTGTRKARTRARSPARC